jgi:hypothetical protein
MKQAELLSGNIKDYSKEAQRETIIISIISKIHIHLEPERIPKSCSVKKFEHDENSNSEEDIYEKMLLLYEDIDSTTLNNCSTNTHSNIEVRREGVLVNVPLKIKERVKESLHTTPVKQQCNCIEKYIVLQQQMQEEFQWKKRRKLKQLEF